jgi:hypothetical protein
MVYPIERLKALVLDTVTSPESKRISGRGIERFLTWFQTEGAIGRADRLRVAPGRSRHAHGGPFNSGKDGG